MKVFKPINQQEKLLPFINIYAIKNLLKVILIGHVLILIKWNYFLFDRVLFFKFPILEIFNHNIPVIHFTIFTIFSICVLAFFLGKLESICLLIISMVFLYFILSDLFFFHHDIFLASNITFLFGLLLMTMSSDNFNLKDYNRLIIAFRSLVVIVLLFSCFHKLNPDFHKGLLINKLIEGNSLFKHFIDLNGNKLLQSLSPTFAKMAILGEFIVPVLLCTRYKYWGAAIGVCLNFGICFFSGAGLMFNIYLPLLYLFFIPLQKITISKSKISTFIKRIDFYKAVEIKEDNKQVNTKSINELMKKFLPVNPLFILMVFLFCLNTLRVSYNLMFN